MRAKIAMSSIAGIAGALLVCAAARATEDAAQLDESSAAAEQEEARGEPDAPYPPQHCEPVFGDADAHAENRAHRQLAELEVEPGEHDVSVNHSTDWHAPTPLDLDELELVETWSEGGAVHALVYLDASFEEQGCDEGHYLIEPDDAIGAEARVLAVLEDVVLLEHGGELRYLRVDGVELPEWRMLWHSPWVMVEPPDYGKVKRSRAQPRSAAKKRRAAKKHKRKKRR